VAGTSMSSETESQPSSRSPSGLRAAGNDALGLGDLKTAQTRFHEALRIAPRDAESHVCLGKLRQAQQRHTDALAHFQHALVLSPSHIAALTCAGMSSSALGRWDDAKAAFGNAVNAAPDDGETAANFANLLHRIGDLDAAAEMAVRAVTQLPNHAGVLSLAGAVAMDSGDWAGASKWLEAALGLAPDDPEHHYNLSFALLQRGLFERGWIEHDFGLNLPQRRPEHAVPVWAGEPLTGKTVIVSAEQGLGDEVMFASCVLDLAAMGAAKYVLDCDTRLTTLFARSFEGVQVLGKRGQHNVDLGEDVGQVDYQISIGSLPRYLRTGEDAFPQRPGYLLPDEVRARGFFERASMLGQGKKIGISWTGGGLPHTRAARSIALGDWVAVLTTPGAHFVSLQYGDHQDELRAINSVPGVSVHDLGVDPISEVDDFAALISTLDLVISIDNSTVHFAGALGIETWAILPPNADWRWMSERIDTPWYPSVELLRRGQNEPARAVMSRTAEKLHGWKEAHERDSKT
jgi:Tfp pilus assembly protein PilF